MTTSVYIRAEVNSVDTLSPSHRKRLLNVADRLQRKFGEVVSFKLNAGKTVGNFNLALCRDVTDCADAVLAEALALSDVRDEIEVLYSKLVRTDFDDAQE